MYDVRISDSLYRRASQAAEAEHVTVDELVERLVQESLDQEPLRLSPEQLTFIRKGQADVEAGHFLTMQQLEAKSNEYKAEWRKENRS